MPTFVTFLSDFGLDDDFVGICHGVINRICPEAQVIHVTHGIRPQAVGQGARVLAAGMPYLPIGVHLAVVDPGVGSERRAIALRTEDGRFFVGPDNGLLMMATEVCGGIVQAVQLTSRAHMLGRISHTFHGRDVFSPAAAYLAAGVDMAELGPALDPAELVRRQDPEHRLEGSLLTAMVQYVDRFGNIQLAVTPEELDGLFRPGALVEVQTEDDRYFARCAATFADVDPGEFMVFEDASGLLSVAINRGRAAELTSAEVGQELRVQFDPSASLDR
jgi:S-adenosyl-L-methionine hydrolase (adenosine-forming)